MNGWVNAACAPCTADTIHAIFLSWVTSSIRRDCLLWHVQRMKNLNRSDCLVYTIRKRILWFNIPMGTLMKNLSIAAVAVHIRWEFIGSVGSPQSLKLQQSILWPILSFLSLHPCMSMGLYWVVWNSQVPQPVNRHSLSLVVLHVAVSFQRPLSVMTVEINEISFERPLSVMTVEINEINFECQVSRNYRLRFVCSFEDTRRDWLIFNWASASSITTHLLSSRLRKRDINWFCKMWRISS